MYVGSNNNNRRSNPRDRRSPHAAPRRDMQHNPQVSCLLDLELLTVEVRCIHILKKTTKLSVFSNYDDQVIRILKKSQFLCPIQFDGNEPITKFNYVRGPKRFPLTSRSSNDCDPPCPPPISVRPGTFSRKMFLTFFLENVPEYTGSESLRL